MPTLMRALLFAVAVLQTVFAVALFLQLPLTGALWPFPGATPLTFMFLSSMAAASAASHLWVASTRQYGALVGIALDYVAVMVPTALFGFWHALRGGGLPLLAFGGTYVFGALFGLFLLVWSVRIPLDRSRPMPLLVRWSFVLFVVVLLVVSTLLVLQTPNILPWKITPDLSVLIGLMFLGAAAYFVYGLLRPAWSNAAGQLAGFLAYDLVLIVPFLQRLPTVAPEFRLGLYIYTAVVVYSGLLAVFYLFLYPPTRIVFPVARAGA